MQEAVCQRRQAMLHLHATVKERTTRAALEQAVRVLQDAG
jgi:hypothetical protein